MIIPLLDNAELKDKRVLLRLDFDHLFEKNYKRGKMQRFSIAEPSLRYLLNANAKVVIAPSFTQANKKNKTEYSVEPYARYICDLYKCNVYMTEKTVGSLPLKLSHDMEPGSILFLENLFGMDGEKNAEEEFAEKLSMLGDIYVNEAFSLSSIELASNTVIVDYFDKENIFAGLNFSSEYSNMFKLNSAENLFTLCLNKDNDLTGALVACENLIEKVDRILLLGELSNLYSTVKNGIENHNYSKKIINKLKKVIKSAEVRNIDIVHMVDYYADDGNSKAQLIRNEIINNKQGYIDIGDETGKIFSDAISESNLVFWLGDLPNNKEGDLVFGSAKIFDTVDKHGIYVIGTGTDTVNPGNKNHIEDGFFKFQSSCYNTFVNSVTGGELPVIEKLEAKFR